LPSLTLFPYTTLFRSLGILLERVPALEATEAVVDGVEPVLDELRFDVAEHDVVAVGGGDLCDPASHRSRADDADSIDLVPYHTADRKSTRLNSSHVKI